MARKGRRSTNEERIEAIRLLRQGYTREEVANILNVAESSVYDWQSKFRKGGLAALSTKIASGRKRLLTDEQLLKLYRWLRGNPRQVQFDFGLWTRKIVRDLIRREFGINYSLQNVGKILKMLGFSPQRPVWRALERDPEKRRKWMEETSRLSRSAPTARAPGSTSQMRRTPAQTTTPVPPGGRSGRLPSRNISGHARE